MDGVVEHCTTSSTDTSTSFSSRQKCGSADARSTFSPDTGHGAPPPPPPPLLPKFGVWLAHQILCTAVVPLNTTDHFCCCRLAHQLCQRRVKCKDCRFLFIVKFSVVSTLSLLSKLPVPIIISIITTTTATTDTF